MNVHLAGIYSRPHLLKEHMKLYIAGSNDGHKWSGDHNETIEKNKPYILESFYYLREQTEYMKKMFTHFTDFLLDSGAFTFLNGNTEKCNWDEYTEKYAKFINTYNVNLFFELDIDPIVGLKEVERLREKLEKLTNKKCIPVWHRSRGLEYWHQMTKKYNYVAIGGIVTKEIKRKEHGIFTQLLKIAYNNKCKVHGLGYTNMSGMKKYKFYSVDSTSWLYGNRGGYLYQFDGVNMNQIKPENKRLKGREAAKHNFNEWIKYQKYAETNL
ncbi:MAG: hypothetical protein Unbinned2250contig1000_25 [Prokaryotic dsDNA virus sp.]|nr:MAG: hypothetical protein Unbinned2250contig1000_25 [Prokaryotic dsDNA virus sp.]|tara:strand:- start:2107 stop:2913 length:807 start_codon:yes stop_codon:yes gene_type:complete